MSYIKGTLLQAEDCQTTVGLISGALDEVEATLTKSQAAMLEAKALWPSLTAQLQQLEQWELDVPGLPAETAELRQQVRRLEGQIMALKELITPLTEDRGTHEGTTTAPSTVGSQDAPLKAVAAGNPSEPTTVITTPQLAWQYLQGALPLLLMLAVLGLSVRLVISCPYWFYR